VSARRPPPLASSVAAARASSCAHLSSSRRDRVRSSPPGLPSSGQRHDWCIHRSLARLQLPVADRQGTGQTTAPQANRLLCSAAASYRTCYIDTGRIVGWADAEFQRPRFPPCGDFHADGPRKTGRPVSGRQCRHPCFPPSELLRRALPCRRKRIPSLGQRPTTPTSPDRKHVVRLWRKLDARAGTDDASSDGDPLVQIRQQQRRRRRAPFAEQDAGHYPVIAGRRRRSIQHDGRIVPLRKCAVAALDRPREPDIALHWKCPQRLAGRQRAL